MDCCALFFQDPGLIPVNALFNLADLNGVVDILPEATVAVALGAVAFFKDMLIFWNIFCGSIPISFEVITEGRLSLAISFEVPLLIDDAPALTNLSAAFVLIISELIFFCSGFAVIGPGTE